MSFQEWLPKTDRNRVALVFAIFALILLPLWNIMPAEDSWDGWPGNAFAKVFWPSALNPLVYTGMFLSPGVLEMMAAFAGLSVLVSSAMSLLMIPFWRWLHANATVRLPIAIACLAGALVIITFACSDLSRNLGSMPLVLMALNLLCVSVAMFTFGNELGWALPPVDPRVPSRRP